MIGIILFIGFISGYAQEKVSFFEEHIDFELDSIYFSVNGIYSFYNSSDNEVNQHIVFPFATEAVNIDSVCIMNLTDLSRIRFRYLKNAVAFNIKMMPRDTIDVNIFYKQKTSEKNTYIITSTQLWKQPLKKAVYTLTTSLPVDETRFSYPFISKEIINDNKILYRWEKIDFMPDKEFEVSVCMNLGENTGLLSF
jgi:hypothetical protein